MVSQKKVSGQTTVKLEAREVRSFEVLGLSVGGAKVGSGKHLHLYCHRSLVFELHGGEAG